MELLCIIPGLDQSISNGESTCLISSEVIEIESSSSKSVLDVVDNLSLNRLLIGAKVGLHELPHLFGTLLGVVIFEFRL